MIKFFRFSLCILFLLIGINTFSQDSYYQPDSKDKADFVRKGKITFSDGKSEKFKKLRLGNELVTYFDMKGNSIEQKTSAVFKITKTGNYAIYGALVGGISGLISGLQSKKDLDSVDEFFGNESSDRNSLIMAYTAGGAVFGGLIGMLFKRNTEVYKNKYTIGLNPTFNSLPSGQFLPMLSFKITLK